jgi:hypothetical protein
MMNKYAAFLLIGLPTWAVVDGTWALLSQLADVLPEGYSISAYLMLSLTLGNILPLVAGYVLTKASRSFLRHLILLVLTLGGLNSLLLAVFWQNVVTIYGVQVSLALFILFFVVGACSSTSNVTHYVFVSTYDASNTTSLALGMGLGSMVAGVLAIAQGLALVQVGYSASLYFASLALLYIPAIYSLKKCTIEGEVVIDDRESLVKVEPSTPFHSQDFLRANISTFFLQVLTCSLGYGVVPALISYACGRFSDRQTVLLLATGIAAVVNPWSRLLTDYYRIETIEGLWQAALCLLLLSLGLVLCASLPPSLPLFQEAGGVVPVTLYVLFGNLFGYINTCMYRFIKTHTPPHNVHHAYRWFGVASQTGALLGSVIAFIYVASDAS